MLRFCIPFLVWPSAADLLGDSAFINHNPPVTVAPYGSTFTYSVSWWSSTVSVRDFQLRKPDGNVLYTGQFGYNYTVNYPISAVDSVNEGQYSIYVVSLWPYASQPVILHVSPAVLCAPRDTLCLEGASTSMGMVAGPSNSQFQWVSAASGAVLWTGERFTPSLTNNGMRVFCRISNPYGSVSSSSAVLRIVAGPRITGQPTNVTVSVGTSAAVTVAASGSPPLSYQWYKNGIAVQGANLTYLSFPAVSTSDAGTYAVTVSNPYGSVTSSNAALTVLIPPAKLSIRPNSANSLRLQVSGAPGAGYVVEKTTTFAGLALWQPVATNSTDSRGTFSCVVSNTSLSPPVFFRVKAR